jgi:GT2 family glycosyltransferase
LIVVYHKNNRICKVVSDENCLLPLDAKAIISEGLYNLAVQFPESKIVWCKEELQDYLNLKGIAAAFHHNKLMLSYHSGQIDFLGRKIGYVEESPFIKINKKVSYPTWQMSSTVGVVHASLLLEIKNKIKMDADFDYYLNSVAKVCMPLGLLCYSEPQLLNPFEDRSVCKGQSFYTLFKFVKQHYKTRWVFLLFFNLFLYERQLAIFPFLASFFYKKRNNGIVNLEKIEVRSKRGIINKKTIDVIIPTIGRKSYLYDVLQDLAKQTLLPEKVVIVEQNPLEGSESELNYLVTKTWPFEIKHIFTHQSGACNARNLALNQVESEWVFLADDDNRFEVTLIEEVFLKLQKFGFDAVTTAYPQKNESNLNSNVIQSATFGAGNSFVNSRFLKAIEFNMGFEFGYGEDNDFGMQLRNQGHDVLYVPEPVILHLKAPMGGFRTKPVLLWQNDCIQPKPSPTVMLYLILHNTQEQILGYKTTLFFKFYKHQKIIDPFRYYLNFQKQWEQSVYWANKLKRQDEV